MSFWTDALFFHPMQAFGAELGKVNSFRRVCCAVILVMYHWLVRMVPQVEMRLRWISRHLQKKYGSLGACTLESHDGAVHLP
eukprot:13268575-Ditylum_brightwellii.AAC.1